MLRDGTTGDWIGTFLGHKGATWQARLSADGTLAATASADFTAKIWDTQTGECLRTIQHPHIVRAIAFPPQTQPQLVATGGFDKKLRVFELGHVIEHGSREGESLPTYEVGAGSHTGAIKSVLWCKDLTTLVTACEDRHIRWFDLRTCELITSTKLEGPIGTCELSNTSETITVAAGNEACFFSGSVPGQLVRRIRQPNDIVSLALNESDRRYVTGGGNQDTWVRVWNWDGSGTTGGESELDIWKGHHGPVWSLAFSPDNKLCASGSEDGTIKLWKFCDGPYGLWR